MVNHRSSVFDDSPIEKRFLRLCNSKRDYTIVETIRVKSLSKAKRLTLLVSNAENTIVRPNITPIYIANKRVYKCKMPNDTLQACRFDYEKASVSEKIRYARLTAGIKQKELAMLVGVDRGVIFNLEHGITKEETMSVDTLVSISYHCNRSKYFCCNEYHIFLLNDYGDQIKTLRKSMKMTQQEFANLLNVSRITVRRWEKQEKSINIEHYKEILKLLKTNVG